MKQSILFSIFLLNFYACGKHETPHTNSNPNKPLITESGVKIAFPNVESTTQFICETTNSQLLAAELTAPASVAAIVVKSYENPQQNLVLFDNPELSANYTAILQHLINTNQKRVAVEQQKSAVAKRQAVIKQKNGELDRVKDLLAHGAATGKDLVDIQIDISNEESELIRTQTDLFAVESELANEKMAILEHEAKLKMAGFDPEALEKASANIAWIICTVPEIQLSKLKNGTDCQLAFASFPSQIFTGKLEAVGDVVDNVTRMVKLRIKVSNPKQELKAGMFANVTFGTIQSNYITVAPNALITVQGKNYIFVKTSKDTFERRLVQTGQQIAQRVVIYNGLQVGEQVVTDGTMQLKGLSFGY